MNIAISMWSLHSLFLTGELSKIDFIKYAASLGVKGVELGDIFGQYTEMDVQEIREVLKATDLDVACYALSSNLVEIDSEKHELAVENIKRGLSIGSSLGTRYLRVLGGQPTSQTSSAEGKSLLVQGLSKVLPFAEETGIIVCLENSTAPWETSAGIASILDEINSPYLASSFHMANFLLRGESLKTAYENLKGKIALVRAKDVRLPHQDEKGSGAKGVDGQDYVGSVLGLGLVPISSLVEMIEIEEYTGWIMLEYEGLEEPLFGTEASLKNLKQYLRNL